MEAPPTPQTGPRRLEEIASVQTGLVDRLKDDPIDIAVKIAAADRLGHSVATAVLAQQIRSIIDTGDP